MLVVHETTSELEMHNLDHSVICWCKNHRQLARQEGGFVACFPLDILMVHSSTLIVATDGESLACGGFSLNETIHFGSPEFIVYCFDGLSLSPKGSDSGAIQRMGPSSCHPFSSPLSCFQ
jgi:hypothetical protein